MEFSLIGAAVICRSMPVLHFGWIFALVYDSTPAAVSQKGLVYSTEINTNFSNILQRVMMVPNEPQWANGEMACRDPFIIRELINKLQIMLVWEGNWSTDEDIVTVPVAETMYDSSKAELGCSAYQIKYNLFTSSLTLCRPPEAAAQIFSILFSSR